MSKVRLLSKREVDVAKAKDRQKEVNEGRKLAERIDALREMAADEEHKFNTFRTHTLAAIQDEINSKIRERDLLNEEIQKQKDLLNKQ